MQPGVVFDSSENVEMSPPSDADGNIEMEDADGNIEMEDLCEQEEVVPPEPELEPMEQVEDVPAKEPEPMAEADLTPPPPGASYAPVAEVGRAQITETPPAPPLKKTEQQQKPFVPPPVASRPAAVLPFSLRTSTRVRGIMFCAHVTVC